MPNLPFALRTLFKAPLRTRRSIVLVAAAESLSLVALAAGSIPGH